MPRVPTKKPAAKKPAKVTAATAAPATDVANDTPPLIEVPASEKPVSAAIEPAAKPAPAKMRNRRGYQRDAAESAGSPPR
jgi:hypothetical protein